MIVTLATHAMGTRFELVLGGDDETLLTSVGEEAICIVQHWHTLLNYFAPDSEVSRINRSASTSWVRIDHDLSRLLARCSHLWKNTNGAFDITIAPLMEHFGFREDDESRCSPVFGFQNVEFEQDFQAIRFLKPGMKIDLGGIAKGWVLDEIQQLLLTHGIACALIHGGTSSVLAIGMPPEQDAWKVKVASPNIKHDASYVAHLNNTAFSTSAPHGREVMHGEQRVGHVIDPRNGKPAGVVLLAAVVCDCAADADAWATALIVLKDQPPEYDFRLSSLVGIQSEDDIQWLLQGSGASDCFRQD